MLDMFIVVSSSCHPDENKYQQPQSKVSVMTLLSIWQPWLGLTEDSQGPLGQFG